MILNSCAVEQHNFLNNQFAPTSARNNKLHTYDRCTQQQQGEMMENKIKIQTHLENAKKKKKKEDLEDLVGKYLVNNNNKFYISVVNTTFTLK